MPKTEGQRDCLGERLPERPAERLAERLPERILKLNKTKLNISKESTKKGSEAILEQPKENKLKNAEFQEVKLCPVNSFGKKREGYSWWRKVICKTCLPRHK